MGNPDTIHKDNSQNKNQVRGKDLKSQMQDSAEYGKDFRAENQGPDKVPSQNNPENKNPPPEKSGE